MTYSYTQISQYLTCPRRYRHRYLDGLQEKDVRAPMLFGRCFEQAVAALFRHEDPSAVLFEQWAPCKNLELTYSGNDTWDHMFQQGVQLLERFTQDARSIVVNAQLEARGAGHRWIGTEHMLIAAAGGERTLASRVLAGAGLTTQALRRELAGPLPAPFPARQDGLGVADPAAVPADVRARRPCLLDRAGPVLVKDGLQ